MTGHDAATRDAVFDRIEADRELLAGPMTHPRGPSAKLSPGIPSRSTRAAGHPWAW